MTISRSDPNTIYLGGPRTEIGDMAAKEAILPGHLVERINTAGVWQWRKHATAGGDAQRAFATEQTMLNKTVSDTYAIGDLMEVSLLTNGSNVWPLIASGQTLVFGDGLESAGDGTLRKLASGVVLCKCLESKTTTSLVHIRADVV